MNPITRFLQIRNHCRTSGISLRGHIFRTVLAKAARLCLTPLSAPSRNDPYHAVLNRFVQQVNQLSIANVLEIGSRARSGNIYTEGFGPHVRYRGLDIIPGPNVDLVGDIHKLSSVVEPDSLDAIFCISVFEHLAMPWKAAVEINRTLKTGGLFYVSTHPIWPLHDRPWDFFRFSSDAFHALFNPMTGFEIVEVVEGLPCRVIPLVREASTKGMETNSETFLGIAMIARKIGPSDPRLHWDVDLKDILTSRYPG